MPAPAELCDPGWEPIKSQSCSMDPCPPKWSTSDWSSCTHKCGLNGTQTREVKYFSIINLIILYFILIFKYLSRNLYL